MYTFGLPLLNPSSFATPAPYITTIPMGLSYVQLPGRRDCQELGRIALSKNLLVLRPNPLRESYSHVGKYLSILPFLIPFFLFFHLIYNPPEALSIDEPQKITAGKLYISILENALANTDQPITYYSCGKNPRFSWVTTNTCLRYPSSPL